MGLQLVNKEEITALWTKIKKNFAMVGQNAITSGSLMYFDSAKLGSDSKTVSTLGLPASNVRDNSVLGITSGLPAWKTISSSLAFSETTANQPKLKVTVLGTDSSLYSVPLAGASASGFVSQTNQTFAGLKKFNNSIRLPNSRWIYADDTTSSSHEYGNIILGINDSNKLLIGHGTYTSGQVQPLTLETHIYGTKIISHYGASRDLGSTLDNNGDFSVVHNIQSTQGGVAAMGLADLSVSGSGGGSGTVKEIYIGNTLYPTDVDGKVTLPVYPSDFYTTSQADSIFATQTALGVVTGKIPSAASSSNQLADKAFVNSSIATATATFRGTVTATNDTSAAAATALATITTKDLNDYAFVKVENTPQTGVDKYKRYKYNGTSWDYEYTLNNSSFTSDQWNAINSGVTSSNWVKTADIKTLTFGSGTTTLVYTPNSGNSRSLLAGSHLSFSISGNNATLNVSDVADSSSASAISTGTSLVSERDVYHGLPTINNAHNYTSSTTIYAPTGGGTANQYLKSAGATSTPVWASFTAGAMSWTKATASTSTPTLNITTNLGESLTAAIPAARAVTENNTTTYYSGVVTTGQQDFTGNKIFNSKTTFNSSLELWTNEFQYSPDQSTEPTTRKQDLLIGYNTNNNLYNGTPFWRIYSYEESPSGIGYMPIEIGMSASGGNNTYNGALFFSGNLTDNPHCWGVGTPTPQYKFHVNGTFGVESTSTFKDSVNVANGKYINFYDNPSDQQTSPSLVNVLNLNSSNNLHLGYGMNTKGYNTYINGNMIVFRYGSSATTGMVLTADGNLGIGTINPLDNLYVSGGFTATSNIQSTGGGVAAMGIADLALSGGGGGSGTVQSLQVNTATPIIPDTDGKLSLDAALTSGTTNAVSLSIGGDTLNITQSTLRTALGLGAAAYLGTTTSVTSGSGALVTSGGVYTNTVSALGTSGNNLTWTKGGTTRNITVPYATDADTVDGTHRWEFYKHGRIYQDNQATKNWYLVGEASETGWSKSLTTSFYVCSSYTNAEYGILNVTYRTPNDATSTNGIFEIFWTVAVGIDPSNFVFTYKNTDSAFTFRLYVKVTANWRSYSFRKLNEASWGTPTDRWNMKTATRDSAENVASIPNDETQVISTISDVKNKAADSYMLGGVAASSYALAANYLPLTGGTMTLDSEHLLNVNTSYISGVRFRNTYGSISMVAFYSLVSSSDTYCGDLGFSGVNNPIFRKTDGTMKTLWHAGNANLEVTRDSQQEPTGFEFAMGAESIGVSTVGVDYINNLS